MAGTTGDLRQKAMMIPEEPHGTEVGQRAKATDSL